MKANPCDREMEYFTATQRLNEAIKRAIDDGDPSDAQHVYAIACNATEALRKIAMKHPDNLKWIAKDVALWPSFRSVFKQDDCGFDAIAAKLDFGKTLNLKARKSVNAPLTQLVVDAVAAVNSYRDTAAALMENPRKKTDKLYRQYQQAVCYFTPYAALPVLSAATVEQWWKTGVHDYCWKQFKEIKKMQFMKSLQRNAGYKKDYDARNYMVKKCEQALRFIAKEVD